MWNEHMIWYSASLFGVFQPSALKGHLHPSSECLCLWQAVSAGVCICAREHGRPDIETGLEGDNRTQGLAVKCWGLLLIRWQAIRIRHSLAWYVWHSLLMVLSFLSVLVNLHCRPLMIYIRLIFSLAFELCIYTPQSVACSHLIGVCSLKMCSVWAVISTFSVWATEVFSRELRN